VQGFFLHCSEFHVAEGKQGVFSGDDKDERNEWTKLADRAQSQKGEIANKIIKQHTRLIRIRYRFYCLLVSLFGFSFCSILFNTPMLIH
jgi:hypothetical protein